MRGARLERAVAEGLFPLPDTGSIAVWRPRAGDDLGALPLERVDVITGFRPDHDHFAARGLVRGLAGPHAAALVCLPRARDHARALVAEAVARAAPGAAVAIDGQKTDGIDTLLRDLRARGPLSDPLAKAHGRIAVLRAGAVDLGDWAARDRVVEGGLLTRPGVFSADGADRGSALLAAALPAAPGRRIVDLGAGWGYLSRAILSRDGVERLDLVEAEAEALDCARRALADPRARFHWADARLFRPESPADAVVCNPPFHVGREADPALGLAFVEAAGRMLAPHGVLWLVANRHLPYDAALIPAFATVEEVAGDAGYRVIRAARPRRPRPRA
jgi:16S rRNA (guanine1207-N2)-methyltransferase